MWMIPPATQHGIGPPGDAPPAHGEVLVLHIDTETLRDEDQDRSHYRLYTEEVRGVMMPMPQFETDKIDQSQRQKRHTPELKLPGTDRWNLGH